MATRSALCKIHHREYLKQHYQNNKQYYINKGKKRSDEQKIIARNFLTQYLSSNPCVDCGETDMIVLEFDHRDDVTKVLGVGTMISRGYTLDAVKSEISKCEVRCCNCHRRRTAKQLGWWTQASIA